VGIIPVRLLSLLCFSIPLALQSFTWIAAGILLTMQGNCFMGVISCTRYVGGNEFDLFLTFSNGISAF
jgi:hypothetical protein